MCRWRRASSWSIAAGALNVHPRRIRPMMRMKRPMLALGFALAISVPTLCAQEAVNETVIAQIKAEAFQRSEVMDTLSWLSDVYGPRLTGSPTLRQAAEWARDQLTRWGMVNAALEPSGSSSRGWSLERFSIEMTEPQYMRITGYPRAWSPALASPLIGTPTVVDVKSKDDFEKYRGKLRGAIVMNGRPDPPDIGFQPEAKRLTDEELKKQEGQVDPAASAFPNTPKSYWDEEDEFVKGLEKQKEIDEFFARKALRPSCRRAASARTSASAVSTIRCGIRHTPASSSPASTTAASFACSIGSSL